MSSLTQAWEQIVLLVRNGGFVMPPLLVAAGLLWYALGYRMLLLRRGSRRSVRDLVARHRGADTRPRPRGVIGRAIHEGLELVDRRVPHLRRQLDEVFGSHEDRINAGNTLVKTIVIVAPLTGLLGTVSGMIETFDSLADMSLFSQSGGIAGGISEALISTQMGLAVAIPGLLVGRMLGRRQTLIEMELAKLKDLLCGEVAP